MEADPRTSRAESPVATETSEQPVLMPRGPTTSTPDSRSANVRDALLWGAAFVPFLALAVLPRRSQLNRLRGEIASLSRQSTKQSKLTTEVLAELRQSQDDAFRELRDRLADNTIVLSKLRTYTTHEFSRHDASLRELGSTLLESASANDRHATDRAAVDRAALATLEEARIQLAASRRYVTQPPRRFVSCCGDNRKG